ncbi:hypothetical protein [Poseidonocella sp. HB161398]|uniref:hypothetical protein n=1 Tax=Poseidonocella sp. HB161398 TaxID=2320855 RepID=UPI0011082325|nr:hypothetical protein [Poseidonocella sp. HB161398]
MQPSEALQQSLDHALKQHGFRSDAGQFLRQIDTALEAIRAPRPASLSAAEKDALASVGALAEEADETPRLQAAALRMALLQDSVPVAEAARLCGVKDSRIRQRLIDGSLLGLRSASGRDAWRLPAFQFDGGRELPGLGQVLKARRPGCDTLAAASFLITPQPDLLAETGEPMTPRDWLATGGQAAAVIELIAGI